MSGLRTAAHERKAVGLDALDAPGRTCRAKAKHDLVLEAVSHLGHVLSRSAVIVWHQGLPVRVLKRVADESKRQRESATQRLP